jgi:ribonuclease HII
LNKILDKPTLIFERNLKKQGYNLIAGLDEAGRGPIAGPVIAASVILDQDNLPDGINDSKKLSAKTRELIFDQIMNTALVGVGISDTERIDSINILNATKYAMNLSCRRLAIKPDLLLVDGNFNINNNIKNISIVKGDTKSKSIAAASIIAKVIRDRIMKKFSYIYPEYSFVRNKGYPTKDHIDMISSYGACPIHRKSFKPICNLIKDK